MLSRNFKRKLKRNWPKIRISVIQYAICLFVMIASVLVLRTPYGLNFEMKAMDFWFALRGEVEPPEDVVIVAVDDYSFNKLKLPKLKPWPRDKNIEILNYVREDGATKIIFDFHFKDALDEVADSNFANALSTMPSVIAKTGVFYKGQYIDDLPLELFSKNSEYVFSSLNPIDYGVARRFKTDEMTTEKLGMPAIGYATLGDQYSKDQVPQDIDYVKYYGPTGTIETLSAYEVLSEDRQLVEGFFKDKIVFVGGQMEVSSFQAGVDVVQTPYSTMFGVESIATKASNIMSGDWIKSLSLDTQLKFIGILSFVVSLFVLRLKTLQSFILCLSSFLFWSITSYYSFKAGYFIPGFFVVLVVIPFVFLLSAVRNYFRLKNVEDSLGLG